MVVGDSQWLGQAVTEGHYLDLTDFMVGEGIADTVTPATLQYYGEYPSGSGNYYSYPTEGDANGWAYRKDLFEDADNQAAFEAAYGYALAVPETWDQLRDIAEFFTRPDDGLYGVGVYTQIDYDAITLGFENAFFSYGANWWDGEDYNVLGVVNSPEAVAALELYKELYGFAPPGTNNAFFAEMNDLFIPRAQQPRDQPLPGQHRLLLDAGGPRWRAVCGAGWPGHERQRLHQPGAPGSFQGLPALVRQ
jgi:multiple sugar transport system substrate-binding protein